MAKKKMTLEEKLEEAIVRDVPYKVPGNWCWIKFGTVCKLNNGYAFKSTKYRENGVPILRISNIQEFGINFDDKTVYSDYDELLNRYYVNKGDLLIAMSGATTGKTGVYNEDEKAYLNQRVGNIKIEQPELITEKFRNYIISYKGKEILDLAYGGAQPNISTSMIEGLSIPLPPLKEQQRIVDKIESLFEKLDKAKELIEETREEFEKRKSAILEKAFRGELTKEWRKKTQINNYILRSLLSQNNNMKKNFKFTQATELFNLPNEWYWIKLKDACEKFKYGTSAKSKEEGKIPVLRMGNLQGGKLDWSNLVYTSDEDEINKYDLKSGDLLFNRTNSPELVGKTSIYEGERDAIYAGYLIRVRTLKDINSKYINYFMNSIFAKHRCMEVKSDGVSQSNINAEKLGDFDIPLPSKEEQNEIVRILDKILDDESKIEELTALEEQIELIKKSILAKAFRGKLGTNCEEDESALELLKEILSKE